MGAKRIRPWSKVKMRDLSEHPPEFERFCRDNVALLCALSNPGAAGITQEDIDKAVSDAISDYVYHRAPYQGGELSGFDRIVTSDRVIRKREDYLHIHARETDEDLDCIHFTLLPYYPDEIQWIEILVDDAKQMAIVTTEHMAPTDDRSRIRWWLSHENGEWKIHEFEPIFS
jgi:hypothetical protein